MEKFIKVYDNILSKKLEDKIESLILNSQTSPKFPLYYTNDATHSPSHPDYSMTPAFFHVFKEEGGSTQYSTQYNTFLAQILYIFCFKNNIILHDFFQGKVFVDPPSTKPGLDFPPHIDMNTNHWVLLYYVNNSDGDTVLFKDDKITELKRVSPKKGRMIFFNGSIFHCGSRSATNTRSAINFNFLGEQL